MARDKTTQTLIQGEVPSIDVYEYEVQICEHAEEEEPAFYAHLYSHHANAAVVCTEPTRWVSLEPIIEDVHVPGYEASPWLSLRGIRTLNADSEADRETIALLLDRAVQAALRQSGKYAVSSKGDIIERSASFEEGDLMAHECFGFWSSIDNEGHLDAQVLPGHHVRSIHNLDWHLKQDDDLLHFPVEEDFDVCDWYFQDGVVTKLMGQALHDFMYRSNGTYTEEGLDLAHSLTGPSYDLETFLRDEPHVVEVEYEDTFLHLDVTHLANRLRVAPWLSHYSSPPPIFESVQEEGGRPVHERIEKVQTFVDAIGTLPGFEMDLADLSLSAT